MLDTILLNSVVAGLLASVACGLGALPLAIKGVHFEKHTGVGYAFAGGLMFAASVYNLILPGLTEGNADITLYRALSIVVGILLGALFLSLSDRFLSEDKYKGLSFARYGGKSTVLIFLAMAIHSIPEGAAVGVGYASEELYATNIGSYIALAIGIHNIPEGLAVAIPLRTAGASIPYCFFAAFLTSLPQPIAAIPASTVSWFFQPIMPLLMGFAAGAMIFLVVLQLIPDALHETGATRMAWAFMFGFCLMIMAQVLL